MVKVTGNWYCEPIEMGSGCCSEFFHLVSRVLNGLLISTQSGLLAYYHASNSSNNLWYTWLIADGVVLVIYIIAMVLSYMRVHKMKASHRPSWDSMGTFHWPYVSWFMYSALLAVKIGLFFQSFAPSLTQNNAFGSVTLQITIGLAAPIFLLTLSLHHGQELNHESVLYITELTGTVIIDILDSIEILNILFLEESTAKILFAVELKIAIIVIACINIILPTIPLFVLSQSNIIGNKVKNVMLAHKFIVLLLVNLPFLIIRLYIWQTQNGEVSVFIVKNMLMILLIFHYIREIVDTKNNRTDAMEMHSRPVFSQD